MLLKLGPEDLPGSSRLLLQVIILNAVSAIVVLSSRYEASIAVPSIALNLALLLGFCYILLRALHRQPRFVQTASALCGVGIVFNLLTWPLLMPIGIDAASDTSRALVSLLMLFLLSWELLVTAHIFRRAIESGMSSAIALSFALFIISITVSQLLFSDAR
jgi:hypothetical protein